MTPTTDSLRAATPVACVSVSSRVSSGVLGNSLVEAAFARRACRVPLLSLDTVQWTAPGSFAGRLGPVLPAGELAAMLEQLLARARTATPGGRVLLLTGYMASAEQVEAVADTIRAGRHPGLFWIADPVMGDNGRLYVGEEVVTALRSRTGGEADLLLPNETEARVLAGHRPAETVPVEELLRRDGPGGGSMLVKSVRCDPDGEPDAAGENLGVFRSGQPRRALAHEPWIREPLSGAGDLFAGMLVAEMATGAALEPAAAHAVKRTWGGLERVANGTCRDLRESVWHTNDGA